MLATIFSNLKFLGVFVGTSTAGELHGGVGVFTGTGGGEGGEVDASGMMEVHGKNNPKLNKQHVL